MEVDTFVTLFENDKLAFAAKSIMIFFWPIAVGNIAIKIKYRSSGIFFFIMFKSVRVHAIFVRQQ